jgi:two-component system cell cycle sensor histidine kinase/response regulator CckA
LRLALEAEEQRLQALVDNLPEGILLLDDAYRVLFSNPTARDYLSILEKEGGDEGLTHLAGRPLEELLQPRPQGLQHELNAPGPPARIFELTTRSIAKGSGVEGWLLLMRDVTAEREFQDRIQQQDRLAAVGQLAAGIAHDFNNIMATVVLYSSILLRSDDLSDKERERLAIIGQQGHRAANLVQQILDFARKSVLERTPLDLVPFLKELEKLLARTLPENIHLRLAYGDADYVVNADPTRVQQVIMNLALNARDAMPRGGELCFALSHLKLGPKDPPPLPEMSAGEWVRFEVSDTGMGIPPENRPHIFEPFFTTKERGKGTGLGLAQVHGIVAQHEGYIDLETQVGHGTTFTIYLPAFSRMPAMMEGSQMGALAEGQGETILVVEDDPNTRAAISETLELLGYAVVTATNGEEALAVFDAHSAEIALVLTDLVMPRMGGVELRALLAGKQPGVKVVAVTGYPLEEEGKSLLEQGIAAWISKPFSTEQLAQTLREVLRG